MKVLVVGGGGREHALIWKILQSPYVEEIYCTPGNGGIGEAAQNVPIPETDFKKLTQFADRNLIDLTVVGPEQPLVAGIVDFFRDHGLLIFGPDARAAELEGSKEFAKLFMHKYGIPTASCQVFDKAKDAVHHVHALNGPFVIKASGLAAGKGVVICKTRSEGFEAIDKIMKKKTFGKAGETILIEEYLAGEEVSVLAIADGERCVMLPAAQDHKAVFEGDTGPNTGGMGAYAPAPVLTKKLRDLVYESILLPVLRGMKKEGREYKGVLYAGLMITDKGPKVLEFNCRFGDPEIQALLPLVKTDIVDLMLESAEGRLKDKPLDIAPLHSACVIMASGGYPGRYKTGKVIRGLDQVPDDVWVFHAGTKLSGGKIVTSGGRVLGVTSTGATLSEALDRVYGAMGKITFDGAYYRRDIGYRAYKRA